LRPREPVLRNPQRERALLEERRRVRRLRHGAHSGGKRDRHDGQRYEDLD
jgi:hypothetical protein